MDDGSKTPKQATPHGTLLEQIMDPCQAKTEREWAAMRELERLRHALLDTAQRVEALKRECGMDPESAQAIRNSMYMGIALNARAALLPDNAEVRGA